MSYPVFIDLSQVKVVLVGGGRIARRKLLNIVDQGAEIIVVAPCIIPEIKDMAKSHEEIVLIEETFTTGHLEGTTLAFAVSDDESVNQDVTEYCREKGILLNNCMESSQSSFRNGAVLRKGELEIAIGTGGKRPGLSKWLKTLIQTIIDSSMPVDMEEIIKVYDQLRDEARLEFSSSKDRETYIKEGFKKYIDALEGINHEN